jgi:hypothetical protein
MTRDASTNLGRHDLKFKDIVNRETIDEAEETGHSASLEKTARRTHGRTLAPDNHPSITGTSRIHLSQDDSSTHTHGWTLVYIGVGGPEVVVIFNMLHAVAVYLERVGATRPSCGVMAGITDNQA